MSLTHETSFTTAPLIFPPTLSKQVHCHDPGRKRLFASNWLSITCDLHKTLQLYVRGWITRKYNKAYCYGSASEKLQGSYVRSERWRVAPGLPLKLCYPPPDAASTVILCYSSVFFYPTRTAVKIQGTLLYFIMAKTQSWQLKWVLNPFGNSVAQNMYGNWEWLEEGQTMM